MQLRERSKHQLTVNRMLASNWDSKISTKAVFHKVIDWTLPYALSKIVEKISSVLHSLFWVVALHFGLGLHHGETQYTITQAKLWLWFDQTLCKQTGNSADAFRRIVFIFDKTVWCISPPLSLSLSLSLSLFFSLSVSHTHTHTHTPSIDIARMRKWKHKACSQIQSHTQCAQYVGIRAACVFAS